MFELTRKVLSGTVLAAITGGVLLWGLSPGMTLKREYESYNGKPALPVGEKRLGAPTIVQVRDGVPTSAWKLTSVADADYPDDKYTRWNAETQDKVYNSLYHYFVQEG